MFFLMNFFLFILISTWLDTTSVDSDKEPKLKKVKWTQASIRTKGWPIVLWDLCVLAPKSSNYYAAGVIFFICFSFCYSICISSLILQELCEFSLIWIVYLQKHPINKKKTLMRTQPNHRCDHTITYEFTTS